MPYLAMALLDYHLALLFNANLRVSLSVSVVLLFSCLLIFLSKLSMTDFKTSVETESHG